MTLATRFALQFRFSCPWKLCSRAANGLGGPLWLCLFPPTRCVCAYIDSRSARIGDPQHLSCLGRLATTRATMATRNHTSARHTPWLIAHSHPPPLPNTQISSQPHTCRLVEARASSAATHTFVRVPHGEVWHQFVAAAHQSAGPGDTVGKRRCWRCICICQHRRPHVLVLPSPFPHAAPARVQTPHAGP